MHRPRANKPLTVALYANAAALTLIAIALYARSNNGLPSFVGSALAQQQMPIGGGAGVFIVPGQFSTNTFGCYIMDVDAQTLAAYQYYPADKQLRLIAARTFRYDRRLGNYNTTPPPLEIRDLNEKEQSEIRAMEQKRQPVQPEEPKKE